MSISTMTARAYRRKVAPPAPLVVMAGPLADAPPSGRPSEPASVPPAGSGGAAGAREAGPLPQPPAGTPPVPAPAPGAVPALPAAQPAPAPAPGAAPAGGAPPAASTGAEVGQLPAPAGVVDASSIALAPPGSFVAVTASAQSVQSGISSALATITTYIPTEILVLYVAVVAALNDPATLRADSAAVSQWVGFLVFLVITPTVVWLVYAGKLRNDGLPLPLPVQDWPRWEMAAATAAFVAWAFAMPGTPFARLPGYNSGVAGVVVLGVTALLGLLAPLVTGPAEA